MSESRLVLHLGSDTYLLPEDVEPSEMIKTLRGMVEVTQQGYGSDSSYRLGKVARIKFEIVDAGDIKERSRPAEPPATPTETTATDDEPL